MTKDWREIEAEKERQHEKEEKIKSEQEELQKKKEANKAEIERLTDDYRQKIVYDQQFSSEETAELKRLIGPDPFEELTNKFSKERKEKDDFKAKNETKNQEHKASNFVSKSANQESAETITTPQGQNSFRSLFDLKSGMFPVVIHLLMWVIVGIVSGVISSLFLSKSSFDDSKDDLFSDLWINMVFIVFTLWTFLYLFGEFSTSKSIRIKGKLFSSVTFTVANMFRCAIAFWISARIGESFVSAIRIFSFAIIWGCFVVAAEVLC